MERFTLINQLVSIIKMTRSMKFSILVLLLFGFSFSSLCQDKAQQIEVKLNFGGTNKIGVEQITIKRYKETISKIMTDNHGIVYISRNLLKDVIDYDLYLTSIGVNGTYLTTINSKTIGVVEISLPKKYQMRFGKAICPRCHTTRYVLETIYTDPPIRVRKIIKGDTIYSPISNGRYYMPTDVINELDPQWYCKKDDILF